MYMTNNTEEWLDLLKAFVEPMTETWKDGFIKGYEHAAEEFEEDCPADSDDIEKAYQSGYRMGGQYAWEVARTLFSMSDDAIERVFLYKNKKELFDKLTSFASVNTIYTAYIRGETDEDD